MKTMGPTNEKKVQWDAYACTLKGGSLKVTLILSITHDCKNLLHKNLHSYNYQQ